MQAIFEQRHHIGEAVRMGAHSPVDEKLVVIFEDDGETGYFYALDLHVQDQPVVDKLYVYSVQDIQGRHEARNFQLCWNNAGNMAFLLVNGYPHAVFDFVRLVGYNHSKYPMPEFGSMWSHEEVTNQLVAQWLGLENR